MTAIRLVLTGWDLVLIGAVYCATAFAYGFVQGIRRGWRSVRQERTTDGAPR